ncbi:hypothetical protein GGF47_002383, partial [Coemansia sp. RSA 2524]
MVKLGQQFGLHPLAVENIMDDATSQDMMEQIGSGWILSFHTSAAQMHVDCVLDRLQKHSNELHGSSFVVYALIYEITDWLTMTTTQIKHDVVQIDNIVMTQVPEEHTGMLQHMGLLRWQIVGIQRFVGPRSNFMAQMSLKMNQTTYGLSMFSTRWLVLLGLMLLLQLVAMAFGQNV